MKHLPNLQNTPPNGWRYKVPETGREIGPFTGWDQLRRNIVAYYEAVGYSCPANLFDLVEAQICEVQTTYCQDDQRFADNISAKWASLSHTFHAAKQCLRTLKDNYLSKDNRPPKEQIEARALVCAECPKNTEVEACSICQSSTLKDLIEKVSGSIKTSVDGRLKFCAVCHCSTKAKVALKLEAVWDNMPHIQQAELPETCWIVKEHTANLDQNR